MFVVLGLLAMAIALILKKLADIHDDVRAVQRSSEQHQLSHSANLKQVASMHQANQEVIKSVEDLHQRLSFDRRPKP